MSEWFTVGAEQNAEESKKFGGGGGGGGFDPRNIFRWYIPKSAIGEEKELIFLDDSAFNCWMHHYAVNGRWGNWETCIKRAGISDTCPLCERDSNVSTMYIGHYTVLDATGWMKDGEHKMSLKIFPAKSERVQLLDKERARRGTLIGAKFAVERTPDSKDNTGNYFSFIERVDLKEFLNENIDKLKSQLDYFPEEWGYWKGEGDNKTYALPGGLPFKEILEPLSLEALTANLGGGGGGGSSSSSGSFGYDPDSATDDGDVPY